MKRKRLLPILISAVAIIGVAVPLQANYTQYTPCEVVESAPVIDFDPFNDSQWVIIEPSPGDAWYQIQVCPGCPRCWFGP